MTRGRRPHTIPKRLFRGRIPEPLADEVDLLLLNPTTGTVAFGARSALLTRLLRRWVAELRDEPTDICKHCGRDDSTTETFIVTKPPRK